MGLLPPQTSHAGDRALHDDVRWLGSILGRVLLDEISIAIHIRAIRVELQLNGIGDVHPRIVSPGNKAPAVFQGISIMKVEIEPESFFHLLDPFWSQGNGADYQNW